MPIGTVVRIDDTHHHVTLETGRTIRIGGPHPDRDIQVGDRISLRITRTSAKKE